MSAATVPGQPNPVAARDGRADERLACDAAVNCRPCSARGGADTKWPGRVREVWSGGLGLLLWRRFEPGAGLAIDLPATDTAAPATVYALVVRVRPETGGMWLLGCDLVSELSEEELKALTSRADAPVAPPARPDALFSEVHFRGVRPEGGVVEFLVHRLAVPGRWPPAVGRTVTLRLRGPAADGVALRMRVDACRLAAGRWFVETTFVGGVPAQLLVLPADQI
jgi:hypothetical protein